MGSILSTKQLPPRGMSAGENRATRTTLPARSARLAALILTGASLAASTGYAAAESNPFAPDRYGTERMDSGRAVLTDHPSEVIDTFTGRLTLVHTDLVVTGNGGLDI